MIDLNLKHVPFAYGAIKTMLGSYSPTIRRLRFLPSALGDSIVPIHRHSNLENLKGIVGWGLKDNTDRAVALAEQKELPYYSIEEGFISSLGSKILKAETFSFVSDSKGIYYDATHPSDLEQLIIDCPSLNRSRAEAVMDRIVAGKISKYNHCWEGIDLPKTDQPKVLLIDQVLGDLSIRYGLAGARSFEHMLNHARQAYPNAVFILKLHPDVIAGKQHGYLSENLPDDVLVLDMNCNPYELFAKVDHVYTVTSQMGFEALLAGRRVSCFGMPFYAGWGLTEDFMNCGRRNVKRTLSDVFSAAYLIYSRYVDPISGKRCGLERILDLIETHKRMLLKNSGKIFCFGPNLWKKRTIRHFVNGPKVKLYFVRTVWEVEKLGIDSHSRILVWDDQLDPDVKLLAKDLGIKVERIDEGFVPSLGLGLDLIRTSSLIMDGRGIYFDSQKPSELEWLLNNTKMDLKTRKRARLLRQAIVAARINKPDRIKYTELVLQKREGRVVILVPGQVEDSDSIRLGCVDICTNFELLSEVREKNPDAYIIYKPHSDVLSGNGKGDIPKEVITSLCDQVALNRDMGTCLEAVDQVHAMTSLTGFEALLRGKQVYTYGLPFYAGWGLTLDRHSIPRRQRKCTLDRLVYCSLVLYPQYYHRELECFVEVEDILRAMEARSRKQIPLVDFFGLNQLYRKIVFLLKDFKALLANA